MKAKGSFSLKDQLFNRQKVTYLAGLIKNAYPDFKRAAFSKKVVGAFPELELKQRVTHIATCLHNFLPADYLTALDTILKALPPELDPDKTDDDFGDFIFAPLSLYAATYGCTAQYLEASLNALKEITKRFSAEYAVRFFINTFPDETLRFLQTCAEDPNYHVRRLASEGTRPKLPWAQKLTIHYTDPLSILDTLYADNTRFVTRSVANHLNDIAKLEPALVLSTLKRWQRDKKQSDKEMLFITRHALRTLVKQGNTGALTMIGYGAKPDVKVHKLSTPTPQVVIGEAFEFSFELESRAAQNLNVDYLMHYQGAKGSSQKVFKIKQLKLLEGQRITLKKRHPMRLMTTKQLYAGEHKITLQINGLVFGELGFMLLEG